MLYCGLAILPKRSPEFKVKLFVYVEDIETPVIDEETTVEVVDNNNVGKVEKMRWQYLQNQLDPVRRENNTVYIAATTFKKLSKLVRENSTLKQMIKDLEEIDQVARYILIECSSEEKDRLNKKILGIFTATGEKKGLAEKVDLMKTLIAEEKERKAKHRKAKDHDKRNMDPNGVRSRKAELMRSIVNICAVKKNTKAIKEMIEDGDRLICGNSANGEKPAKIAHAMPGGDEAEERYKNSRHQSSSSSNSNAADTNMGSNSVEFTKYVKWEPYFKKLKEADSLILNLKHEPHDVGYDKLFSTDKIYRQLSILAPDGTNILDEIAKKENWTKLQGVIDGLTFLFIEQDKNNSRGSAKAKNFLVALKKQNTDDVDGKKKCSSGIRFSTIAAYPRSSLCSSKEL